MTQTHELSPESVLPLLQTQRYGRSLRYLDETGSTNDDAKRDAASRAPDGHVVVADTQQTGRGSHGRTWSSPQGTDLYFSIVDRPSVAFAELPPLTLAVGLGVAEAVETLLATATSNPVCRVKWPNDVWLGGKKCAGILIEANAAGTELDSLVIGIGLNVNRASFPDELATTATSLYAAQPGEGLIDRKRALCVVLAAVERWVDRFVSEGARSVTQALEARLALLGQKARCGDVVGKVLGVSPSGALRMQTTAGVREVIAGRLTSLP